MLKKEVCTQLHQNSLIRGILLLFIINLSLIISSYGQKCDTSQFEGYLILRLDSSGLKQHIYINRNTDKSNMISILKSIDSKKSPYEFYVDYDFSAIGLVSINNCYLPPVELKIHNIDNYCFDSVYTFNNTSLNSKFSIKKVKGHCVGPFILNLNIIDIKSPSFFTNRVIGLPIFNIKELNRQTRIYKLFNVDVVSHELSYDQFLRLIEEE